jgi:dolichyl-phosphate-mannose-protein mannosyltransferase
MIDRLLAWFAALFAPVYPSHGPARRELPLVFIIVAIGAVLRFWGLGSVGLHGDEKTMALPMEHVLEHGTPVFPSGMFYARAIGQVYMMAGSVATFGNTEWAMRLPSALCGVLLILIAYYAGRRFLTPTWNLGFVAAIALLPDFIIDAQTARMYVFLVTSVAGFLALLFAWEKTDRTSYLVGATLVLLIGIQFHTLAIFSALLVFYPGLLQGSWRKIWMAAIAFAILVAAFFAFDAWIGAQYPPRTDIEGFEEILHGPKAGSAVPAFQWWMIAVALMGACAVSAFVVRAMPFLRAVPAFLLIAAGLVAQMMFAHHIGSLLILAGVVIARRADGLPAWRLGVLIAVSACIAAVQIGWVYSHGHALRQTLGALTGWPSIWPFLRISGYSLLAVVLIGVALIRAVWNLAHRRQMPDHVLFVLLGIWLPLFMIGFFAWDIPLRYAAGQSFPIFLGAFAAAQWLFESATSRLEFARFRPALVGASAVACLLIVDPMAVARTVNAGYSIYPDHKGAAAFVRARHPGPRDIVLAEDPLQQTYYLGHIDAWLTARYAAAQFVREGENGIREIYVDAPVVGSGEELEALLDEPDRGTVYVIGSGEDAAARRTYFRGLGIQEVLDSPRFQVVYEGRDGLTKVWEAPPPQAAARK